MIGYKVNWEKRRARWDKWKREQREVKKVDIIVENHGTLFLFKGASQEGQVWLETNLDPECQKWGEAFVVEHRYAKDIAVGAVADGLTVQ
jgi:hypothetical protein